MLPLGSCICVATQILQNEEFFAKPAEAFAYESLREFHYFITIIYHVRDMVIAAIYMYFVRGCGVFLVVAFCQFFFCIY